MKDQLSLGLSAALTARNSLGLEWQWQDFYSQGRERLGDGQQLNLELSHRLSEGAWAQSLRLGATMARFSATAISLPPELLALLPAAQPDSPDFFIPEDYEQVGLFWSMGDSQRLGFKRAWQPFAELGINHSSTQGLGHSVRLGLAGPLLGRDRLLLAAERAESGARDGDISQRLLLNYRYFY